MFKNMIVYRIAEGWQCDLTQLEEALARAPFVECGATQERSVGWMPPRGDAHGPLAESVAGQWVLRFMAEAKVVPGSVVARRVQEKTDRIEQETGRKPGKKEKRDLKDEALLDLLPMAFTKQGSMWVWIDQAARTLVLDTSSQARADEVVTLLTEALPGFALALLHTQTSPQAAMAHWLASQEPPAGFTVDRECELKAADEVKAVVRYARHPLDIEEVQAHIAAGKLPTKLALSWDDRVSFMLTEGLQIKKIAFLDTVFEDKAADDGGFDTDVAIATGELFAPDPRHDRGTGRRGPARCCGRADRYKQSRRRDRAVAAACGQRPGACAVLKQVSDGASETEHRSKRARRCPTCGQSLGPRRSRSARLTTG